MDRFEHMQTFVKVVEAGSISAAAERMEIAKSAVSRRIATLEERLKVQLFRRSTRRLSLTETGRGYYERCLRILADLEEAELAVSQAHGTLRGSLRVAAPLSFGLRHLGPAINDFLAEHPEVEFDLDFNDREVDLLAEGFDVAVRIARLPDSSLIARRLWTSRLVVCASPGYLRAHGRPRRPAELAAHRCLVYANAPEPNLWRFRSPEGREEVVRLHPQLRANNGDYLAAAAVAGQGIVLTPSFIAYEALARGTLLPLLTDYRLPEVNAYAVYPRTRHLSQRVRAFVDFLAARYAGVPYWDLPPGQRPAG